MKYLAEEGELGQARSGHIQCADQPIVAGAEHTELAGS